MNGKICLLIQLAQGDVGTDAQLVVFVIAPGSAPCEGLTVQRHMTILKYSVVTAVAAIQVLERHIDDLLRLAIVHLEAVKAADKATAEIFVFVFKFILIVDPCADQPFKLLGKILKNSILIIAAVADALASPANIQIGFIYGIAVNTFSPYVPKVFIFRCSFAERGPLLMTFLKLSFSFLVFIVFSFHTHYFAYHLV